MEVMVAVQRREDRRKHHRREPSDERRAREEAREVVEGELRDPLAETDQAPRPDDAPGGPSEPSGGGRGGAPDPLGPSDDGDGGPRRPRLLSASHQAALDLPVARLRSAGEDESAAPARGGRGALPWQTQDELARLAPMVEGLLTALVDGLAQGDDTVGAMLGEGQDAAELLGLLSELMPGLDGLLASLDGADPTDVLLGGAEAIGALTAEDEVSPTEVRGRAGRVVDLDAERAKRTAPVVDRIAASLGLTGVVVRMDDAASARARAVGARGVMEGGEVLLGADVDPTSLEGRKVLAHELAHVAQSRAHGVIDRTLGDPGQVAETEADALAAIALQGGRVDGATFAIPAGHVAADPGTGATDLKAQLANYQKLTQGYQDRSQAVPKPGGSKGNATAQEDEREKLDRYQDGVDGVADLISDLDAFDDLCDACDDGTDTSGPLNRIRQSEPYRQLCDMWQGAVDGGNVKGAMIEAFHKEMDGRGFWASTEKAFELVVQSAKKDAKRKADADAAKKAAATAKQAAANVTDAQKKDAKSGGKGTARQGGKGLKLDPAVAALLDADVEATPPTLDAFEQMKAVTDEQLAGVVFERNHQIGLGTEVSNGSVNSGRTLQILETFGRGFGGGMMEGFQDKLKDGALEFLGKKSDKLLQGFSKGAVKTPVLGPVISSAETIWKIASDPGKYGKDMVDKAGKGFKTLSGLGDTLGKIGEAKSTGDKIGIFCAFLADLFKGIKEVLEFVGEILSVLTTICFVVGAILVIVGIALIWLGWGAGLLAAGNWLIRTGQVLQKIKGAIDAIAEVLGLIEGVFRVAAAFLVPADMYAEQLVGVGEAGNAYGKKTGEWAGDKTVDKVKEWGTKKPDTDKKDPAQAEGSGQAAGQNDAKKLDAELNDSNKKIEGELADTKKKAEELKKAEDEAKKQEADAKKPDEGGEQKKEGEDAKKKNLLQKGFDGLIKKPLGEAFTDIKKGFGDLKRLVSNPKEMAYESLAPILDIKADLEANAKKVDELRNQLAKVEPGSVEDKKIRKDIEDLASEANLLQKQVSFADKVQADLEKKGRLDDVKKKMEGASEGNTKKLQEQVDEKKNEKKKIEEDIKLHEHKIAEQKKAIDDARQKKADAEEHAAEQKKRLEGQQDQIKKHDDAKGLQDKQRKLNEEATSLSQKEKDLRLAATSREAANKSIDDLNKTYKGTDVPLHNRTAQVVEVRHDGVMVLDGGTKKLVPFDKVQHPELSGKGTQIQGRLERANTIDPDGRAPSELRGEADGVREQITSKRDEATALDAQIRRNEKDGLHDDGKLQGHKDEAAKHEAEIAKAQERAGRQDDAIAQLEGKVSEHEAEKKKSVDAKKSLEDETKGLEKQLAEATSLAGFMKKGDTDAGKSVVKALHKHVLPLLGGLLGTLLDTWAAKFGMEAPKKEEPATPAPAGGEKKKEEPKGPITGAIAAGKEAIGKAIGPKTEDELKAIGKKQAELEALLSYSPPADLDEMFQHRQAATDAFARYVTAHVHARKAKVAEDTVKKLSEKTLEMKEAGTKVKGTIQNVTKPIPQAVKDEEQRKQQLEQTNAQMKEPDGIMAKLVGQIMEKVADNSDAMKQQPDGGGVNGNQLANSATDAKKQKEGSSKESKEGSDQQREFLDAAIQEGAAQEVFIDNNIATLDGKYAAEQQTVQALQIEKATALTERNAAGEEAKTHAGEFNARYAALKGWADEYKKRREAIAK